jgi:hypothetical protein
MSWEFWILNQRLRVSRNEWARIPRTWILMLSGCPVTSRRILTDQKVNSVILTMISFTILRIHICPKVIIKPMPSVNAERFTGSDTVAHSLCAYTCQLPGRKCPGPAELDILEGLVIHRPTRKLLRSSSYRCQLIPFKVRNGKPQDH